jgi:hypothetical protein
VGPRAGLDGCGKKKILSVLDFEVEGATVLRNVGLHGVTSQEDKNIH